MTTPRSLFIVPSRSRPQNVERLIKAWEDTGAEAQLLIAYDIDDPSYIDYAELISRYDVWGRVGDRQKICAILNDVVNGSIMQNFHFEYVGFMGDDHLPRTPRWDKELEGELDELGTGVAWANDLLQGPQMPTMVLMDARIISTLGYMVPPTIEHLCADLVWKDLGEGLGRVRYRDDVVVEHMHPANGKASMDALYAEVNSSAQATRDAEAYYAYRDEPPGTGNPSLKEDIVKLRSVLL